MSAERMELALLSKYLDDSQVVNRAEIADKLSVYAALLVEHNKVCNLTAITDPDGISIKHFIDCTLPLTAVDLLCESPSLIDVGTGAGFPGMVLALFRPAIRLTLMDSSQKRLDFLAIVCEKLGIKANLVHARAEDAGRMPEYREQFDCAISRAVASLDVLSEYCLPLVCQGGRFISMKGPNASAEIDQAANAVSQLGGELASAERYTLPDGSERSIVVYRKAGVTPDCYPRTSKKIAKQPL